MDSYTVTNFGALASKLSVAHVVEVYRHAMAQPNWTPAVTQFLTEFVTHGVFIAILFYHFSMKWFEYKFTDRSLYEKRKGFWKKLMAGYNLVLSLYSAVTFVVSLSSLRAMGMYGPDCGALFSDSNFDWAARLFYYSKYVEFADTWFLVIAGKPVSWLQYFHHAGACLDMWVLYRYQNEGIWLFVQFNSFIHTIMYAYFACTALGINVPGKQVVTLLQILQLTIGNSLAFVYPALSCYAADPFRLIGWVINFVYINCLVVLFVHFAVTTYILPSKGRGKGKGKAQANAQPKALNGETNANGKHANGNANGNGHANGGAGEH